MTRPSEKARALAHTVEAYAIADIAMSALRESTRRNVEAYAAMRKIQAEIALANREISGPEFVEARVVA